MRATPIYGDVSVALHKTGLEVGVFGKNDPHESEKMLTQRQVAASDG
ncbi:MAG: hypothetical protein ABJX32_20055 [Tateyamaria sp.]